MDLESMHKEISDIISYHVQSYSDGYETWLDGVEDATDDIIKLIQPLLLEEA